MQIGDIVKGISNVYGITNTDMTRGVITDVRGTSIKVKILQHVRNQFGSYDVEAEHFEVIGQVKVFNREELLSRLEAGEKEAIYEYNLSGADLSGANLRSADLRSANLRSANLSDANLRSANLRSANLRSADLRSANLSDANLRSADLSDVLYGVTTSFFALQCPEKGSFIGYKKAQGLIVELRITEDAKRSSATSRKCRCSKAEVLSITNKDGSEVENRHSVESNHDCSFKYQVGQVVEVSDYDENRWNECAPGIHFFITRDEAVQY